MKLRRILGLALAIIILGIFTWYTVSNWEQFSELRFTNPLLLIPAMALTFLNIYGIGALLAHSLQPLGVKLTRHELLGLASLNRFLNLISPGYLGAAVRAVYLKKTYKFSFASFSSSFVASNIILFLVSGLLALASFTLSGSALETNNENLIIVLIVAVAFFVGTLVVPLNKLQQWLVKVNKEKQNKFLERLAIAFDGFIKIRAHSALFYSLLFWAAITVITTGLMTLMLYQVLGYNIGFLQALFISAVSSWGIIISITPANIGIREGLMVLAAQIVGAPIPETLAVAILLRLVAFVVAAVLSIYYAPKLLNVSLKNIGSIKKESNTKAKG